MDEQVERHESKQDVFEDALDELRYAISLAKEPVAAEDLSGDELLDDLRARYAAAGKVPVPREVGEWIDHIKDKKFNLYEAMLTAQTPLSEIFNWVVSHSPEYFAEAWIHGWYAEEDTK